MEYEIWRPEKNKTHQPSLLEMVEKAIKILSRNSKGFFLMVEGRMYFIFILFLHSIMEGGGGDGIYREYYTAVRRNEFYLLVVKSNILRTLFSPQILCNVLFII